MTKKQSVVLLTALSLLAASLPAHAGMAMITVNVRNISTFDHVWQFHDNRSGRDFEVAVAAGGSAQIQLQSSGALDDGYGDVNYRIKGNTDWNHNALLRHGETMTL